MKYKLHILIFSVLSIGFTSASFAQRAEWRLVNAVFNPADPDGAGPATGSVSFTMQIHAMTTPLNNITAITTGWSWQSAHAMVPTVGGPGTGTGAPGCTTPVNTPANVVISPEFATAGFLYNTVNECLVTNQTVNSKLFDRTTIGTLESSSGINLTTTWVNVFTVTMWTRNSINPRGGFVIINSSNAGTPGPFSNYELSDALANAIEANTLTYAAALGIPSETLPVILNTFDAVCLPNKTTSITWSTERETNNDYFEVEKSINGSDWKLVTKVFSSGNTVSEKSYQVIDAQGGAAQYRLKQVDRNGKVIYSPTVRTTCEGRNIFVTLYPVPAKDVVTLIVGSDKSIKTNLQVFDTKGRMLINMPVSITSGTNNFKLEVHSLPAGEYILKGSNTNLEISKRFTVLR
jgi:hypothetical protein